MNQYRTKLTCTLAAFTLLLGTVPVLRAADAPAKPADDKVKKSDLDTHMQVIEESMKKLKRTVRKADAQAESLELLSKIEQEAVVCKAMVPTRAATVPEADRPKFVNAYRKDMAAFITQVLAVESAVIDGNTEQAVTLYKGLNKTEDDSHDKYMPEDEKDKTKADSK